MEEGRWWNDKGMVGKMERSVAGRWREGGGKVEGRWREGGGKVEGRWREDGGKSVDIFYLGSDALA